MTSSPIDQHLVSSLRLLADALRQDAVDEQAVTHLRSRVRNEARWLAEDVLPDTREACVSAVANLLVNSVGNYEDHKRLLDVVVETIDQIESC